MLLLGKVRKRPTRVGRFRFLPVSRQTALRPGGGGLGRGASSDQPLVLWQHHSLSLSYRFAFKLFGNNESMRKLTIRCFVSFVLAIVFSAVAPSTVFAQSGGDVVMVLPFENTSSRPEYNWVGESFADALAELLNKPGLLVVSSDERQLAYHILYQRDKALPFSQNQLVQEATKVPQRAFEAYVKGVQLGDRDSKRANYLKNALHYYADANGGAVYPQAVFELGRFYMLEGKWKEATEYFTQLQKKDPHYAEAAFYAGLGFAKMRDFGHALAALIPLSSDVPLIGIYNNAGAVAVQASREEKKEDERG